jgi:hypothetical protein
VVTVHQSTLTADGVLHPAVGACVTASRTVETEWALVTRFPPPLRGRVTLAHALLLIRPGRDRNGVTIAVKAVAAIAARGVTHVALITTVAAGARVAGLAYALALGGV